MLQKDKYSVINIRKYLESDDPRLGEEDLIQILSEFSCEKNPDVERFLKQGYRNPTGFRRWVKVAGSGGLCYTCFVCSVGNVSEEMPRKYIEN